MAGTTRALVNNMVVGVSQGFERKLQLVGVGYKAQAIGQVLSLSLGSPIRLITNRRPASSLRPQPDRYPDQGVSTSSWSVRLLPKFATSNVRRSLTKAGVRYADEVVRRKEAKKK